ncbi:hypothetical protein IV203_015324 [Nitzschia inconspicua]|uniref:Uncharacterized protein n=1 Tax=Nitzschia inconspicua TaxID=303405 RepID=A0A9K3PT11_9STRA|nr:hypothetical protein IV203_015324 [Nitzschia inconspicua]
MREEFRILKMYAKEGDPTCTAILMKWSEKVDVDSASYMKAHDSMCENFPKFKEEFLKSNVSLQIKDKNYSKSYQKCWRHHVKKAFEIISQQPKVHQATKLGDRSVLNGTTSPSIGVSLCTIAQAPLTLSALEMTRLAEMLTWHPTQLQSIATYNIVFSMMNRETEFTVAAAIAILVGRDGSIGLITMEQISAFYPLAALLILKGVKRISPHAYDALMFYEAWKVMSRSMVSVRGESRAIGSN